MTLPVGVIFLTLVSIAGLAHAEPEESPMVTGEKSKSDSLHIESPRIGLELVGRYNSSSVKPSDGETIKFRDITLDQLLTLSTAGDFLDPNFFKFNASGTLGIDELWQRSEAGRDNSVRGLYAYSTDATLFGGSQAPLTLSASRTIEYISQPFSETYRSTSDNFDATWNIKSDRLPTYFRVFHNDLKQDSPAGIDDFRYVQEGAEWHTDAIFSPTNRLSWNVGYSDVHQTDALGHDSSFDVTTASLVHSYLFGLQQKDSLISTIDYMDQQRDFAQQRFRIDENLLLHHNDRFETFYQYQLEDTQFSEADTSLNRLKGGFRLKVFDSLQATGTLGGMSMDQSGAATDEFFAHLDFDYTKKVPYGLLTGMLQFGLDQQSNQAQSTEVHVIETRTFDASQQIIVPFKGIQNNSINVRDAAGTRLFFPTFDYLVTYQGNRAVIQRTPGSSIAANSSILIDYDMIPRPANDVATDNVNMGLRYDVQDGLLKGVGVYTRYFAQDQNVDTNEPGAFVADNVHDLVYGAEYRVWRLLFSAEHEDHLSDLVPFRSNRYSARYEDRLNTEWRFFADATQVRTHYLDDDSNPIATTLSGRIEYRPNREIRAGFNVSYLKLSDDLTGGARGLEEELNIKWTRGDTTLKASIRNSTLRTDPQESSFVFFQIGIERKF
jgi:hypothetical protein